MLACACSPDGHVRVQRHLHVAKSRQYATTLGVVWRAQRRIILKQIKSGPCWRLSLSDLAPFLEINLEAVGTYQNIY
jgi:hypothetical protein